MKRPQHTAEEVALGSHSPPGARTLAAAGIAGPVLFTAGFLLLGVLRRGEYDPAAGQISNLTAGPYGWAQQVSFIVFGLLLIAFAVGLDRALRPTRAGLAGPAILACNGVGLVLAGVFPLCQDAAGMVYDPNGVHSPWRSIFQNEWVANGPDCRPD